MCSNANRQHEPGARDRLTSESREFAGDLRRVKLSKKPAGTLRNHLPDELQYGDPLNVRAFLAHNKRSGLSARWPRSQLLCSRVTLSNMPFSDLYQAPRRGLSFELFPPKKVEDLDALEKTVTDLNRFSPDFFTCTYGAGGSSQDRTLEVIERVKKATGLPVASHLTCVGSTVDQLRDYLTEAKQRGVEMIVALRGDPPRGEESFKAVEGGLRYANELVDLIRAEFPEFGIAVAGYPEVHQEAISAESDLDNLKRKVDAGGEIVITQLFYDNADFYRFRDRAVAAGIAVPIVPGLLPITNLAQALRITSMCKARLPDALVQRLSENESAEWQFDVGVEHARRQAIDLLDSGADGLHLYILNKSRAAEVMLDGLEIAAV